MLRTPKKSVIPFILAAVLAHCGASSCGAELVEVTTKNGLGVTGELVSVTAEKIVIRIDQNGIPVEIGFDQKDVVIFLRNLDAPPEPEPPEDAENVKVQDVESSDKVESPDVSPVQKALESLGDAQLFTRADANDPDAQVVAARRYLNARPGADCERAIDWLRRAAAAKVPEAEYKLGVLAQQWRCGERPSIARAVKHFTRAWDLGHLESGLRASELLLQPGAPSSGTREAARILRRLVAAKVVRAHPLLARADPAGYRGMCKPIKDSPTTADTGRAIKITAQIFERDLQTLLLRVVGGFVTVDLAELDVPGATPGRVVTVHGAVAAEHKISAVIAEVPDPGYKLRHRASMGCPTQPNSSSRNQPWSVIIEADCTTPQSIQSITVTVRCRQPKSAKFDEAADRDLFATVVIPIRPSRSGSMVVPFEFPITQRGDGRETPTVELHVDKVEW